MNTEVAEGVRSWRAGGVPGVFARVLSLQGFSTWAGDELVAWAGGQQYGDVLGRYGAEQLAAAGEAALAAGPRLDRLVIDVHGSRIAEAGLACGGQAELLLQPTAAVPDSLWGALAGRAPVALVTVIDGRGAGPLGATVHPDGRVEGAVGTAPGSQPPTEAVEVALGLLRNGRTDRELVEHPAGTCLVESWVPTPRLVVVGSGGLLAAIDAQARLLGWETKGTEDVAALDALFDWGGVSTALVVLTHDPRVDTPALAGGLARGIAYVGAMGSRRTQSKRTERLSAQGVDGDALARIHRPIGLDLGGRRPAEVALAICAEILAAHSGRDGRPLAQREGPIHG